MHIFLAHSLKLFFRCDQQIVQSMYGRSDGVHGRRSKGARNQRWGWKQAERQRGQSTVKRKRKSTRKRRRARTRKSLKMRNSEAAEKEFRVNSEEVETPTPRSWDDNERSGERGSLKVQCRVYTLLMYTLYSASLCQSRGNKKKTFLTIQHEINGGTVPLPAVLQYYCIRIHLQVHFPLC